MLNSLRYKLKIKNLKKAQFFILSAFIITSIMFIISRWIEPLTIVDTSSAVILEEPFIFNNIVEKAREVVISTRDCNDLRFNLDEYKNFVEKYVLEKGMVLNFSYSIINCQNVNLEVSLFSERMTINTSFSVNRS